jgi:hypothetical protein
MLEGLRSQMIWSLRTPVEESTGRDSKRLNWRLVLERVTKKAAARTKQ